MPAKSPEAIERRKERDRIRQQWRAVYAAYLRLLKVRGIE